MRVFICQVCQRSPKVGQTRSHSMAATKRIVLPNIQKVSGRYLCTRCQRTETKTQTRK